MEVHAFHKGTEFKQYLPVIALDLPCLFPMIIIITIFDLPLKFEQSKPKIVSLINLKYWEIINFKKI